MTEDTRFFTQTITVRMTEKLYKQLEQLQQEEKDKYESISHCARCMIIRGLSSITKY